jgi:putative transcriptional regulator
MTPDTGMQPRRHPSDATLLAHAAGTLGKAHRLVVEIHAKSCSDCQAAIRAAERVGGLLLEELPPTAMAPGALELCLTRLETNERSPSSHGAPRSTAHDEAWSALLKGDVVLPPELWSLRPGRLRRLAPGILHASLLSDRDGRLHFIRVSPEVALPRHSHPAGLELTLVLAGSFHDDNGRYQVGDVGEQPDCDGLDHLHLVRADPGVDCICILATAGRLRFANLLPRMLQPILPF